MKNVSAITTPVALGTVCILLTIGISIYQNSISQEAINKYEKITTISLLTHKARSIVESVSEIHQEKELLKYLNTALEQSKSLGDDKVTFGNYLNALLQTIKDKDTFKLQDSTPNQIQKFNTLNQSHHLVGWVEKYRTIDSGYQKVAEEYANQLKANLTANENARVWFRLTWLTTLVLLTAALTFRVYKKEIAYRNILQETETRFKHESNRVQSITKFINAVTQGKLDQDISLEPQDGLFNPLVEMKTKLTQAADSDRIQNWKTHGLALLAQTLQRITSYEQSIEVTRFIVQYTNSNQGALFILNSDNSNNQSLELASTYAYDKQKYLKKSFSLGEGLAGQAILEKQTIYMTQVPQNYVRITSGLGDATPTAIIIVPLLLNNVPYGVLELASFKKYRPYEIEFLEKISESIASAMHAFQSNQKVLSLLTQSQSQARQLQEQEEELRQNMEELTATQEQMNRQLIEMKATEKKLLFRERIFAQQFIIIESDQDGIIIAVNEKLCKLSGYKKEELINKPHNMLYAQEVANVSLPSNHNTGVPNSSFHSIVKFKKKDGSPYWIDLTIEPMPDEPNCLLHIGHHLSQTSFSLREN